MVLARPEIVIFCQTAVNNQVGYVDDGLLNVLDEILHANTAFLPSSTTFKHDTPLQRQLELWRLTSRKSILNRQTVERHRESSDANIRQFPLPASQSANALRANAPDLADAVLPYMSSRAYTALAALGNDLTDVQLLCELSKRPDTGRQGLENEEQYMSIWRGGAKRQTA